MDSELSTEIEIPFANTNLLLCGDGCVFIPTSSTLLVADLHLGKDASFRAAGIPVPNSINEATLNLLTESIRRHEAQKLIILGDLIHDRNSLTLELDETFARWRQNLDLISCDLVRGNHDRHVMRFPDEWKLSEHDSITIEQIELVHEIKPSPSNKHEPFQIGGHWHPVVFVGRGADRTRFPCFAVAVNYISLPAFGPFKGGMVQSRSDLLACFPISEGKIWLG